MVSNDQLRDHKAGMAMPTAFSDWAETHIARYEFQHAVSSDKYEPMGMCMQYDIGLWRLVYCTGLGKMHVPRLVVF